MDKLAHKISTHGRYVWRRRKICKLTSACCSRKGKLSCERLVQAVRPCGPFLPVIVLYIQLQIGRSKITTRVQHLVLCSFHPPSDTYCSCTGGLTTRTLGTGATTGCRNRRLPHHPASHRHDTNVSIFIKKNGGYFRSVLYSDVYSV